MKKVNQSTRAAEILEYYETNQIPTFQTAIRSLNKKQLLEFVNFWQGKRPEKRDIIPICFQSL